MSTGYESLSRVLRDAHDQAALGKGKERHANGLPFDEQPILKIARLVGIGYQTGQAMKKATEAGGMLDRGQHAAARAELLGAINYLAAAVLLIDEKQAATPDATVAAVQAVIAEDRDCDSCKYQGLSSSQSPCRECVACTKAYAKWVAA